MGNETNNTGTLYLNGIKLDVFNITHSEDVYPTSHMQNETLFKINNNHPLTITMELESGKTMSTKRFIKLLMSKGYSRNQAKILLANYRKSYSTRMCYNMLHLMGLVI